MKPCTLFNLLSSIQTGFVTALNRVARDNYQAAALGIFITPYTSDEIALGLLQHIETTPSVMNMEHAVGFLKALIHLDLHGDLFENKDLILSMCNKVGLSLGSFYEHRIPIETFTETAIALPKPHVFDYDYAKRFAHLITAPIGYTATTSKYKEAVMHLAQVIILKMEAAFLTLRIHTLFDAPKDSSFQDTQEYALTQAITCMVKQHILHQYPALRERVRVYEFYYNVFEYLITAGDYSEGFSLYQALNDPEVLTIEGLPAALKHKLTPHKKPINLKHYWGDLFTLDEHKRYKKLLSVIERWNDPFLPYYQNDIDQIFQSFSGDDLILEIGKVKCKLLDCQLRLAKKLSTSKTYYSKNALHWINNRLKTSG